MGTVPGSNSVTQSISSLVGNNSSQGASSGTSTSSTSSNISSAQQSLAGDQQTFLTLLTTQLQNQDPMNPMDTDQFTQQLVAMTGVQQQIMTNQLLQQLVGNQTGVGSPVDLLGKTVTATSSSATLAGGDATWQFTTAAQSADVKVTITNSLNQVVSTTDLGALTAGAQTYSWNGKDSNGNQLPDGGTYTLAIAAVDQAGNPISTTTDVEGTVSAVSNTSGQAMLTINGTQVPTTSVTSVLDTQ
jgi:flagellar basal-body rod modification protein FlgD